MSQTHAEPTSPLLPPSRSPFGATATFSARAFLRLPAPSATEYRGNMRFEGVCGRRRRSGRGRKNEARATSSGFAEIGTTNRWVAVATSS